MTSLSIALTANEEVTLRRVAFGESPARTLRAEDLARLRLLRLIADGKDGPCLTAGGRTYFSALPKPVIADRADVRLAAEVDRVRRMRTGDV